MDQVGVRFPVGPPIDYLIYIMRMVERTFTDATFEQEVMHSDVPVLVDFWAPWCAPCRIASPIVDRVATALAGKPVKVGKLNVDENTETAQKFGILSIPTFLIFKGGKVVEQIVGVPSEDGLKSKLTALIS